MFDPEDAISDKVIGGKGGGSMSASPNGRGGRTTEFSEEGFSGGIGGNVALYDDSSKDGTDT